MKINLEKVGYVYSVDRDDFDYVNIITKNKMTDDEIKRYITENFTEYDFTLNVELFEIYDADEVFFDYEEDFRVSQDVYNISNIKLKHPFLKRIKDYVIELDNFKGKLLKDFEKYSKEIIENGFDKNTITKLKNTITKLEQEYE